MESNSTQEIDLLELFMALLYKWWIIVLSGFVLAVAAFCVSKFVIAPTFESTTTVYVISRQNEDKTTSSDMTLGNQIIKDTVALVTSRSVAEEVIDALNLDIKIKEFNKMIATKASTDTRFLSITVTHTEPAMAQKIADELREVVARRAVEVMKIEVMNVVDYANLPTEKSAPSVFKNTLIGGLIGVFLAAGIIAVLFLLNDRIKTPDDVEKYLKLSTLGSIPYDAKSMTSGSAGKKANKEKKKR